MSTFQQLFDVLLSFGSVTDIMFIAGIAALGGFTKGTIGFGLPTIAVPLLTNFMPVPIAISITLTAILLSNAYQALFVGSIIHSVKRFWPLLFAVCATLTVTTQLLVTLTASSLLIVVGVIIMVLAGLQVAGIRLVVPSSHEKMTGFGIGVAAGIMGGITSLFSMPLIMFLSNLRLGKDEFINAISLILFSGALVMAIALARYSVLTKTELIMSFFILIPLTIGYLLGAKLRHFLNPEAFLRLVLIFLICNGAWLVIRGLSA